MQLSQRFLGLVQQQLDSFESEKGIKSIVIYIAQTKEGQAPSLQAIGQWPSKGKALPPVEADLEVRSPSPDRRWYPLQEGANLMGVIRAERFSIDESWSKVLDQRLQATAAALAQCLGLEQDRVRLLDELTQQREKVGLMVHQIRNPLAALRTYAQLLLRKIGKDSNHRDLVEGLLTEQDQLNRYLSALDELSQIELPASKSISSPLLLPPVLEKGPAMTVKSLLEPLIARAFATANLQERKWCGPEQWPEWSIEPRDSEDAVIAEIVANLLENAFRYSPISSSVGLFLNNKGICVWDGGSPISNDQRERIFERGIRGKNIKESSGSGIGLALGRQLSEQLGGELKLIVPPCDFDASLPKSGNAFAFLIG